LPAATGVFALAAGFAAVDFVADFAAGLVAPAPVFAAGFFVAMVFAGVALLVTADFPRRPGHRLALGLGLRRDGRLAR
jgi:hypothetical protein